MHFGATTTQRVEGSHSALKHALETSGSLTKAFNSLDRWLHLHCEESSLQKENESIGIDPLLVHNDKNRLAPLLGKVAQFALNKIKNELLKTTTYTVCLCNLCVNYNIPCKHILPAKGSVMLSTIPERWLLFPDQDQLDPNSQVQNLTDLALSNSDKFSSLKSCLYEIESRYVEFPDEQQKSALLEKLDEVLVVPVTNISDVKAPEKIVGKGRPSGTKRPKILISPRIPINDIDQIYDPKSDGNCGFRSLAVAIRENEENWILVKLAMSGQLTRRMEIYKDWLGYNTDLISQILECRASLCSPSLWFLSPDCAQLAADTFSVPIAIFDELNRQ
ncbi:8554_t:CDS:2, partial [Racocetra persica]